jgi:phosphate transport system protein
MFPPGDDQLHRLTRECATALRTARTALGAATEALVGGPGTRDMEAAESALRALRDSTDTLRPTELPPPVGRRTAVAAAHVGGDLARVAELTRQIAEVAWSRRGKEPLPEGVRSAVETVSGSALTEIGEAAETVGLGPAAALDAAARLDNGLGAVSDRQRVLDEALVLGGPQVGVPDAVELALVGRCYEDCARHAVSAARRLAVLAR